RLAHAGNNVVPARPLNAVPCVGETAEIRNDPPWRRVKVCKGGPDILLPRSEMKAAHGIERRDVIGTSARRKVQPRLYRLAHMKQVARSDEDVLRPYKRAP